MGLVFECDFRGFWTLMFGAWFGFGFTLGVVVLELGLLGGL